MVYMTVRKHKLLDVSSALQKAIRRADARLGGYWAVELFESGYQQYLWRRLLTISAEDCWGLISFEIEALYHSWNLIQKRKKGGGRIFASKAVILLCQARKCRDADHLQNLVYDEKQIDEKKLEESIAEARKNPEKIPEYAFDCHTLKGKRRGLTKKDFFRAEQAALSPRKPGLFDDVVK